jgi:histidinol-phosphate aminotransferase
LHQVPYRDDREDLAALAERAHAERARVVYVANPDNPMGTWRTGTELTAFRAALPADTLLCLDEAYADTAPPDAIPAIDIADPGVLRFRTFSKAYGLAGLRVGYAFGEAAVVAACDRVRDHFGVGRIAQAAALAALEDQTHLADCVRRIAAGRERIAQIALANGLVPIASAANFVTVDLGRDGPFAKAVLDELGRRGIFLRMPGVAPLDRCIRFGVGLPAELDALERELPTAFAAT